MGIFPIVPNQGRPLPMELPIPAIFDQALDCIVLREALIIMKKSD
jgi:hypothetical protein